ncbi:diguanylate cyclase domain-containing protein [Roseofilum capinflatum]|uniref:Diguanylate cyclase n=1 Tax=Roseofilum capinflatum BLCC-M114 TaxID=3022440 RepID=A0ABT7BBD5_9CYAN|nr:diguanylate cyclase [Roseofilum capinflatum]MDJ1176471.1 diguanylate cyclase [Roseofilum capinflatum BLCC-M114]
MNAGLFSEKQPIKLEDSLVLVVDDNPSNLKVLRGLLSTVGYKLTFAMGGRQALERVITAKPDLILLDLMMPDMDGFEVCDLLKKNPEFKDIPIIFLTASQEIDHLLQAFEKGAIDYLTKPFHPPELLARVKTHLELKFLREQSEQQAEQELILVKIIQGIHDSLNLEDILSTTVASVQQFLGASRVMIGRCLSEGKCEVVSVAHAAETKKLLKGDILELNVLPESTSEDQRFEIHYPEGCDRSMSQVIVPIYRQQILWGVLIVDRLSKHGIHAEYGLLERIVEQIAIAIRQVQLYHALQKANQELERANQELDRLAHIDALTQVANRRYFDQHLQQEWLRLRRDQQPLSIIICDIDYFKQYNDTYGHLVGDRCLTQVAQALSSALKRPADLIARYGGEEFAAILPNTPIEGAIAVAEQMQQAIATLKIPHIRTELSEPLLTISLGIASMIPSLHSTPIQLLDLADRALYEAKHKGRNQYSALRDYRS